MKNPYYLTQMQMILSTIDSNLRMSDSLSARDYLRLESSMRDAIAMTNAEIEAEQEEK